jgi:hypothetical protein
MHDMNNEDVEKTLDDINKMAKIEKIHEGDSYFDKLADEVEIEIRDVLKHEEVLNKQLEEGTSISKSKVFRLKEGQNLMFDFPPHFLVPDRGNLVDFNENIAVKVITPKKKKRKLSAKERERRKLNLLFYKLGRSVALAVMLFALGMIGEQIYGYVADHEHMIRIRDAINNLNFMKSGEFFSVKYANTDIKLSTIKSMVFNNLIQSALGSGPAPITVYAGNDETIKDLLAYMNMQDEGNTLCKRWLEGINTIATYVNDKYDAREFQAITYKMFQLSTILDRFRLLFSNTVYDRIITVIINAA